MFQNIRNVNLSLNSDRGPFITALGRTWCPGHFVCAQASCGRSLQEVGFVEEQGISISYQNTCKFVIFIFRNVLIL